MACAGHEALPPCRSREASPLHRGDIAEMQTGEGKTLVATLPAYLNALTGEGVHVVTVNDYLAKRDSEWMGTSPHAFSIIFLFLSFPHSM